MTDMGPMPGPMDSMMNMALLPVWVRAAWAVAFRDSLNSDALMQVVLHGINARKPTGDKAPGAEGAATVEGESH
jgi:hypothetical protein